MTRTERWRDAGIHQGYPRSVFNYHADNAGEYIGVYAATSDTSRSARRSFRPPAQRESQGTLVIAHGHS